jgi:DNA helicase-2/ATP-dependent DNA helicase PcrA
MNLTTEQTRAVASPAPHKRILACAGSGKTAVLVEQVCAWLAAGVDPVTMAVITFTRRAAEELRRRIEAESKARFGRPARLGYCGTVHGMCYLALALACDGKYRLTPLTDAEVKAVVDHVAEECRMTSAVCPKVVKLVMDETAELTSLTGPQQALAVQAIRYLHAARLVHVGSLVAAFHDRAAMHPELRAWFQLRTRTILWDEFQDTTPAQAAVLDLAAPGRSLVVGDQDQAIYGFAGASDRALRERVAESHTLSYSFRSATLIVDAANRQLGRPALRAWREDAGRVWIRDMVDRSPAGFDAMAGLVQVLIWLREDSGNAPVTVLCRTNREVACVQDWLAPGDLKVAVASPAFDRYADEPWPSLYLLSRHLIDPACEWLTSAVRRPGIVSAAAWDVEPERTTVGELFRYLPAPTAVRGDDHLSLSLLDFVAWYQRRDLDDLMPTAPADVLIMTAHASKGLEWDNVVLAGVGYSLGHAGTKDDREEANLLYVAITRAKNRLGLVGDPAALERLTGRQS